MAKTKLSKLSTCMITQQLNPEFYIGWTDEELESIKNADICGIVNVIGKRLFDAKYGLQEIHGIIHNDDVREVWDNVAQQYVIEQKPPHFHIVCKFIKSGNIVYSGTLPQIATIVGLEQQYVEKAGKGKYAYDNMLSYLIHIKYSDKAQYKPESVYTTGCMQEGKALYKPYMEYYKEQKKEWEEGRAKIKAQQSKDNIDSLEEKILLGEVVKNQILLTDSYFEIYARNKRRCDDAFDTYAQRKIAKTIQSMENGEFKVSVLFVTGKSHSGKSMFTDNLVRIVKKQAKDHLGEDWDVCSCASTNPFDEYQGEEILVMDDLRGMSLSASDWLKLLDPDRINIGSARYRNRKIACRSIIINSEKDVVEFFYYLKGHNGDQNEAMDQFFRRIMARAVVYRVPDSDERKVTIGTMKEVDAYAIDSPEQNLNGTRKQLVVHHEFNENGYENISYENALDYLADCIISNNKLSN